MSSTLSRSAPPAAALIGVIVKLVNMLPNESTTDEVATKLLALFPAVPFVSKYLAVTIAPSGKDLPTTSLPK